MSVESEVVYLDSSALVKLVIVEAESKDLRRYLGRHPVRVTCGLAKVEVPRSVRGHGQGARRRAKQLLSRLHVIQLDDFLLEEAAELGPQVMRSLDAIHVAAALTLGDQLQTLVTYDRRMAEAAVGLDVHCESPGGEFD